MNAPANYVNVMIDMETVGNKPYSGILSVALVPFMWDEPLENFYQKCSPSSLYDWGFGFDDDTAAWWLKQDKAVREEAYSGTQSISSLLHNVTEYISQLPGPIKLWGKGSDFDNCLLRDAYNRVGMAMPWDFRKNRCYRTLLEEVFPEILPVYVGDKHNALADATNQARHATKILQRLELLKSGE